MEKEKKFSIKEIITNKQYRAIVILAVYFIVFALLIFSIRLSTPNRDKRKDDEKPVEVFEGFEKIVANNFNYEYNIKIDEDEYLYTGKKYDKKEKFILKTNNEELEYYIEDNIALRKENEKYVLVDRPTYIFDYFDTALLNQILLKAALNTKESNSYKISNNKLDKILEEGKNSETNDFNYITVFYQNKTITKIVLDFTNYSLYLGNLNASVIITLEYKDFNLVEDFEAEK